MTKTKEEIIKEYEIWDNVPKPEPVELEDFTFEELVGEEYFK